MNDGNRLTFDSNPAIATSYFSLRTANVISQMRSLALYPNTDAPELNQFGGNVAAGFIAKLTIPTTPPAGTIVYYTTDGTDPRLVGGSISSTAILYTGTFAINDSRRVR